MIQFYIKPLINIIFLSEVTQIAKILITPVYSACRK